ncbi:MAG: DUF429 domain-containing protein [Alphaproteobacteria bacterium]|nr:DUF429 domain-containing protein [Alphaproteobacteria bacterium]MBM3625011.1 DUF429 domain-containing protein [Alphaproteobacteria bacterium]MBM3639812.1 DUF429 domain-containing protein [Alphaproteobacteria bacterium]
MRVYGIDFTSTPSRRKPLACLACTFDGGLLRTETLEEWRDFSEFERALKRPGPWIAGIDFPFGQSRQFIENIGWPADWAGYVRHAQSLGRAGFRKALDSYRASRPDGDREHRRQTDMAAGSISPQKLYRVPIALMFFEGAPRLIDANVMIPRLQDGDPGRIVVEAYPGMLARSIIGRRSYKQDTKKKQTEDQRTARLQLLAALRDGDAEARYSFAIETSEALCDNPGGDHLDALLCAIQAAWAWRNRENGFGAPETLDAAEGWIADPQLSDEANSKHGGPR